MSAQDFGANDWLVDEMYEQYLQDPNSVDPAWVEYFKTNKPGTSAVAPTPNNQAVNKGVPPVPKAQQKAAAPVVSPVIASEVVQPVVVAQQPIVRETAATQPTPADPIVKPVPVLVTPSASTLEPIRGVSARVVQSMEGSLAVPTATSVRATTFPPLFVDALAWHLAVRLAMPLTRDPKVRADAWQVANQMTGQAQMMDANEVRQSSDHVSELVVGRG